MDATLDEGTRMRAALLGAASDQRVLSVGSNLGGTVLELAETARVLWQVPFCAPDNVRATRRNIRVHIQAVQRLADAGRLVQIDASPRMVLCNLHEDAFDVAFFHGHTTGQDMLQYLEWVKHLASTIIVHDPGTAAARDAITVWAADQGVQPQRLGLLTFLYEPVTTADEIGGWE